MNRKSVTGASKPAWLAEPVRLMFDNGPDPRYTPRLLDLLAAHRVRASFFVSGARAARFAYLVRRMQREGHTVGHVGWHDTGLMSWAMRSAHQEVAQAIGALGDILGQAPRLYRLPGGPRAASLLDAARALDQVPIGWDAQVPDRWPSAEPSRIFAALEDIGPGMSVRLHDAHDLLHRPGPVLDALNRFLPSLQHRRVVLEALPPDGSGFDLTPDGSGTDQSGPGNRCFESGR